MGRYPADADDGATKLKPAFPNSFRIMAWNLFVILGLFLLSVIFFRGSVWFAPRIYPYDLLVAGITLAMCVFVLLPCAVFDRTRSFAAIGLLTAGYVFAATTWLFAFMVVYSLWKLPGLIAGLVLGVVGVIPLALIAALTKALWTPTTLITAGLIITASTFLAATFVTSKLKRRFV